MSESVYRIIFNFVPLQHSAESILDDLRICPIYPNPFIVIIVDPKKFLSVLMNLSFSYRLAVAMFQSLLRNRKHHQMIPLHHRQILHHANL